MEETQLEVEGVLRQCTVEELRAVAAGLQIAGQEAATKVQVLRAVGAAIDAQPDDAHKLTYMKSLLPIVPNGILTELCAVFSGEQQQQQQQPQQQQPTEYMNRLVGAIAGNNALRRRDLKFAGTIDSGAETDMDIVTLNAYIDEARKKNYTDEEIAIAVRKCVAQGSDIRSYLDLKPNMTLETMVQFLENSQKETSSRQLYQTLSDTLQGDVEDASKFARRLLGMREKLLNAAQKEGWVRYTEAQVQEVFLEALRTGVTDDSVKRRIEPHVLSGTEMSEESDNNILARLKAIEDEDEIRRNKQEGMRERKRVAAINELTMQTTPNNTTSTPATQGYSPFEAALLQKLDDSAKSMNKMQGTIDSLQSQIDDLRVRRQRRCPYCVKNNKQSCSHCWCCGAGDHRANDPKCPNKSN